MDAKRLAQEALDQLDKGDGCAASQWFAAASRAAVGSEERELVEWAKAEIAAIKAGFICWGCIGALQNIITVCEGVAK